MIKCKVCGCEFPAIADKHYIARDDGKVGIAELCTHDEERLYDAFDCPVCGCQAIVQERKRKYEFDGINQEEEEDGDEE